MAETDPAARPESISQPYDRPLPAITSLNRPYWDGLLEHRLMLQRCQLCGRHWHPAGPWCPFCWSRERAWTQVSGRGRVSSWVVFHQPYFRAFADDVPYHVAEIELDEGPRLLSTLVGVPNDEISLGLEVEVFFDDVTEGLTLPRFKVIRP
jgi:uncharacterized OB-fold protein